MKTTFTQSAAILGIVLAVGAFSSVFAQDSRNDNHTISIVIPPVALLDLELSTAKNFTASFIAPTEAGDKLAAPVANNSLWLNYSSIQKLAVTKRVDVKSSAVVDGVDISLVASTAAAGGEGTKGTPTAGFVLTTADQKLVDGIGSAYTLTGINNGHQLTYSFAISTAYAALREGSTTVTVTYTLADN